MSARAAPLSFSLRVAMIAAVTAGALVSYQSAAEVGLVLTVTPEDVVRRDNPFFAMLPDPGAAMVAGEAFERTLISAQQAMRVPRLLTLLGLSTAASLIFVTALRLRWPSGLPRRGVARLLGTSALVAAFLRTIDGAQLLVVAQRAGAAFVKHTEGTPNATVLSGQQLVVGLTIASALMSLFVVTLLFALGTYFRSEGVAQALAASDTADDDD